MNLYEAFAEHVAARPEEPAVLDPDGQDLTYRDLDRQARTVHAYLDGRTEEGDLVAVYMMDSPTYVACVLGAWRAGCVVTPVNYRFGLDEVTFVLEDVRPWVLFADDVFANNATEAADRVAALEAVVRAHEGGSFAGDALGAPGDAPEAVGRFDDDPAIVMHTSGTTGQPKGVVQTHRGVGAQIDAGVRTFGVTADDVAVVSVPLFHVGGLHGATLMGLTTGGAVAIQPAWDAAGWARLVEATDATISGLVPAMLVDVLNTDGTRDRDAGSLRLCFYGGSPTPEPVVREFGEAFGVDAMLDYYGQTEVCGLAVSYRTDEERAPGAMGHAVPGLEARVVDLDSGEPVPTGDQGELLLRGDSVMAGYWERPERNEATFTAADDGGPPWLHTDDVVARGEDGLLRYVDRVDDIIHSGGEKVSPARVENVVQELDGVEAVAVLGIPDDRLGEAVTAAVVPADESLSAADVSAHCETSEGLAGYEEPREVVLVESFPRTGSQKVDKVALAERLAE